MNQDENFYLQMWQKLQHHPLRQRFRDISEKKAREARIHSLAFYDTHAGRQTGDCCLTGFQGYYFGRPVNHTEFSVLRRKLTPTDIIRLLDASA